MSLVNEHLSRLIRTLALFASWSTIIPLASLMWTMIATLPST